MNPTDTIKGKEQVSNIENKEWNLFDTWNPINDAKRMILVTEQLQTIYGLSYDSVKLVKDTLAKVSELEEDKKQTPANVVNYVWNNWKVPDKLDFLDEVA